MRPSLPSRPLPAICAASLLLLPGACVPSPRQAPDLPTWEGRTVQVEPDAPLDAPLPRGTERRTLQDALAAAGGNVQIELAPGHYYLTPRPYTDPTCGNCEDSDTPVDATVGLHVSGPDIHIVGASRDQVAIHTNAGYGILFDDCEGCSLREVTVTGGIRDPDERATDAGIVVRESTVDLRECRVAANLGDSATVAEGVVGIMGITGREGSDTNVWDCEILQNSWDGIALYRGARATIRNSLVDGVDKAWGQRMGGGRGVGIGLTWDARAVVRGNLVTRYWKGIGVFVDAEAEVRENIVEEIHTWGIAYWDAGHGTPVAAIEDNVIYTTGACGAMIVRGTPPGPDEDSPGSFKNNFVVRTGQNGRYDDGDPYCTQRPVAREAVPARFEIDGNLFLQNRQPGDAPREEETSRDRFREQFRLRMDDLVEYPALRRSSFVRVYGSR